MKKGTRIEGIVEKLNFPNKGILHIDGRKMTVKNVLPGQKVAVMVTKGGEKRLEGRVLEILENLRWRRRNPARILDSAEAAVTRQFPMRNS